MGVVRDGGEGVMSRILVGLSKMFARCGLHEESG